MPDSPPHVLFVCTGNTCRSPMAEGLFRKAAEGLGEVKVSSAGIASQGGGAASAETLEILAERGLGLEGFQSKQLTEELIRAASHVFCMTRGHLSSLEEVYPDHWEKFYLVCDFAEIDGEVGRDVPDPIGGGRAAYQEVVEVLDQAMGGIVGFLQAQQEE